jgi:hypothetical protein
MEIKATKIFIRCVKPLAKRYRSFRNDYAKILDELLAESLSTDI